MTEMTEEQFTEMLNGKGNITFGGYILDCPDLTKDEIMLEIIQ